MLYITYFKFFESTFLFLVFVNDIKCAAHKKYILGI